MYEFAVTPAITQMRRPGVTIEAVASGSIADEVGLEAGDRIVRVNDRVVRDYLDFRFHTSGETLMTWLVRKTNGETWEIDLERDEGEDFGLDFEQIFPRQCANECLFCFCKGNPEDARQSLFVRDEDIRLSFLYGNYTTLSSITEDEMERIIEQRLSPQYVSVHATDLATRAYLLGVDESRADIFPKVRRLLDNGIEIHAQIVLCPQINDGKNLEKTLRDLAAMHPGLISAAIVPVALTRYNTDERLHRVSPEFCRETIALVEALQKEFLKSIGTSFAFLGDEIYLKAGMEIPGREHYGEYPQIEDGVGMVRTFENRFEEFLDDLTVGNGALRTETLSESAISNRLADEALRPLSKSSINPRFSGSLHGTIITGEMFAPILEKQIKRYNEISGASLLVVAAKNNYFGGDVSVAGLLSGKDFIAVADMVEGDFVLIPEHAVKSDEPILIDGMLLEEVERSFPVPVYPTDVIDFLYRHHFDGE
ncbi:MAG: DUF512 domain-containing protein [Pyrinomonadaceae bacterium]